MDWRNLIKHSVFVGAQLLWGGRYGCNNGHYGCTIVMSYIEINKDLSQWLLTFNLCVSVTWPLTCAFHIPCTHTPEIIDMHRGVCDKTPKRICHPTISGIRDITLVSVLHWSKSRNSTNPRCYFGGHLGFNIKMIPKHNFNTRNGFSTLK